MRGVAHQKYAIPPPLRRDAVVNAINDGVEDFHLVDGTDETNDLVAKLVRARLGNAGGKRIKKPPAVRLAHEDHPFLRVGKVGEIRVVARIGHVEIDLDVDEQAPHVRRLAFDSDAELRAHRAAPAVTGQEVRTLDLAGAVGRIEARDDAVVQLPKRCQAMPQMERPRPALIDRIAQDRFEVVLGHVDDEGIARIFA
jgi:hypothetical protein